MVLATPAFQSNSSARATTVRDRTSRNKPVNRITERNMPVMLSAAASPASAISGQQSAPPPLPTENPIAAHPTHIKPKRHPPPSENPPSNCRTSRHIAYTPTLLNRAPASWTAPVLWRFRPTETDLSRTIPGSRQRAIMRSLTKAEAQPRQGRPRCRIRWEQFPSFARSGIVRRHNPIAGASNPRRKRRADAAPDGALNVRGCVSYKDAAPPALRQWERDWGQGGTCPSQRTGREDGARRN